MKMNIALIKFTLLIWVLLFSGVVHAEDSKNRAPAIEIYNPVVCVVTAGETTVLPPSDATILFDGKIPLHGKARTAGL